MDLSGTTPVLLCCENWPILKHIKLWTQSATLLVRFDKTGLRLHWWCSCAGKCAVPPAQFKSFYSSHFLQTADYFEHTDVFFTLWRQKSVWVFFELCRVSKKTHLNQALTVCFCPAVHISPQWTGFDSQGTQAQQKWSSLRNRCCVHFLVALCVINSVISEVLFFSLWRKDAYLWQFTPEERLGSLALVMQGDLAVTDLPFCAQSFQRSLLVPEKNPVNVS